MNTPVWDARKDRWPTGYGHLCDYVNINGTSRVPHGYTTEDGYNLGSWVVTQRVWKRKGLLTTERQKKLEQLPGWAWNAKKKKQSPSTIIGRDDKRTGSLPAQG